MNHDDLRLPDPLPYQQASMLMLVFRFRGKRKLVASHMMETSDFAFEVETFAPILMRHYGQYVVQAVDVVSYQRGGFYTDPWPDGLILLRRALGLPDAFTAEELEGDVPNGTEEAQADEPPGA
jgi:hypothetical protein